MNSPTWNIVRKDFRLTRPFLLAWWGILTAGAVITVWNLYRIMDNPNLFQYDVHHDFVLDFNYHEELPFFCDWLIMGLDVVLLAVIVDIIIKADSPIDEKAIWRTRPVSGLGVWRAKLMYLGLFCYAVPGAIQVTENVYLGSDWYYCLHGLVRFVSLQSILIAIIASASVLFQRTFFGLLVFCLAAIGVLFYSLNFLSIFTLDNVGSSFYEGLPNAWAALTFFSLTGLGVTALMYAGRRRMISGLTFGGGAITALLLSLTLLSYSTNPSLEKLQKDASVNISMGPNSVVAIGSASDNENLRLFYLHTLVTLPLESESVLHIAEITSHLSWPELRLKEFETGRSSESLLVPPAAVKAAGYGRLLNDVTRDYHDTLLQFSFKQLAQVVSQPARWEGTIRGEMGRLAVDWDVPVDQDAQWIYIQETQWMHNQTIFKLEKVRPCPEPDGAVNFSLWETSPTNWPWLATPSADAVSPYLLLYNPVKKEALFSRVNYGNNLDNGDDLDRRQSWAIYFISQLPASFDLTQIFGTKYPMRPDPDQMRTFNLILHPENRPAYRAYLDAWLKDRKAFLSQHYQEMADWLKDARLVSLHFVADHAIYNTATNDSVQVITPQAAKAAGLPTP